MSSSGKIAIGIVLAGALAGCGGGGGESGGNAAAPASTAAAATGGMPADWKATDACSIIDKATMGEVLGVAVTEASVALVHESSGGADAATSECTYMLADGRATVMTRWSPIADNTTGAIDGAKSAMQQTLAAFGGGEVEDVPGLGKASFWVAKVDQLQSFIGEDKMVLITVPSGTGAKDKAIALAKKAGA